MPSQPSRRGFLAACSVAALGGCSALPGSDPDDVVAGVEWKSIRATRDDRSVPVAETQSPESVEHRAPVSLSSRIHVYDDEVLDAKGISFPESGPLVVDDALAERLEAVYDEITYVLVLTLYEQESVAGVPLGNAGGYRLAREDFNRANPGDRVVVNVEERDGVPRITDLVDVTTAKATGRR